MGKINLAFSGELDLERDPEGTSPEGSAVCGSGVGGRDGVGALETLIGGAEPARLELILEAGRSER